MICAIARYESTLHGDQPAASSVATTTTTTSTTVPDETQQDEQAAAEEEDSNAQPLPFCEAARNPSGKGTSTKTTTQEDK